MVGSTLGVYSFGLIFVSARTIKDIIIHGGCQQRIHRHLPNYYNQELQHKYDHVNERQHEPHHFVVRNCFLVAPFFICPHREKHTMLSQVLEVGKQEFVIPNFGGLDS